MEKDERVSADMNSTRKHAYMGGFWRGREREGGRKKKTDVMINNFLARMRLSLASQMANAVDVRGASSPPQAITPACQRR